MIRGLKTWNMRSPAGVRLVLGVHKYLDMCKCREMPVSKCWRMCKMSPTVCTYISIVN